MSDLRYYKMSSLASGKVLDVPADSKDDGTPIHQWPYHGGANQHWEFADGAIKNRSSGKVLTARGSPSGIRAVVEQAADRQQANQRWQIQVPTEPQGRDTILITASDSSLPLEVANARSDNGAPIQLGERGRGAHKEWQMTLVRADIGMYCIIPPYQDAGFAGWNRYLLGVGGDDQTADGAPVQLAQLPVGSRPPPSMIWRFVRAGNDLFRIMCARSGKVLDVAAAATHDGAPIIQFTDHRSMNQLWRVLLVRGRLFLHSGYRVRHGYRIVSALTGKVLDVRGGQFRHGAIIQQYHNHGGLNQVWDFVRPPQ